MKVPNPLMASELPTSQPTIAKKSPTQARGSKPASTPQVPITMAVPPIMSAAPQLSPHSGKCYFKTLFKASTCNKLVKLRLVL